jgi:hypothetical protein
MNDRRRFVRWQINQQAKVKLEGAEAATACTVQDINFKGACISLGLKLPKDNFVKLSLALSEEFILAIKAWVAWQKTIDGHNIHGLYFEHILDTDKEKIYRFMRRYFPKEMSRQWWPEKGGETVEKAKFQDRRIFERFPAKLSLRFLDPKSNTEGQAQTQDISAKGIGLVTDRELAPHTPLEMWVDMPDKGEPLYTRGEVVWSKPASATEYRAGVSLEQADLMGLSRALRAA